MATSKAQTTTTSDAPLPSAVNIPVSGTGAAGAQSYVKAEQTAKGFRTSVCVVPGTTSEQMGEAIAVLVRSLAALATLLPTELATEQVGELRASALRGDVLLDVAHAALSGAQ